MNLIHQHSTAPVRSLLNMGCGGGKNAYNFKKYFSVTGVDCSPSMLEQAQRLNPDCQFILADIRNCDLPDEFDCVLMDDAISYMTSQADLHAALSCGYRHLRSGGLLFVTPDETKESFRQNQTELFQTQTLLDSQNIEIAIIENDYDPDPTDDVYEITMLFLIRQNGCLRIENDYHVAGLFSLDIWKETLTDIGCSFQEHSYQCGEKKFTTFACTKM